MINLSKKFLISREVIQDHREIDQSAILKTKRN